MKLQRARLPLFLASLALITGGAAIAACSGAEDSDVSAVDGDGGTSDASTAETSTPGSDSSAPVSDGGADADDLDAGDDAGEDIVDGGDLPPLDDGGLDDAGADAGFDAGPACAVLTPGPFVASTCSSKLSLLLGGDLSTANYVLTSVTVLGDLTFCGKGGGFTSYDHRGELKVTAKSATAATFEFLDQYKASGAIVRPLSRRYDVDVSAGKGKGTLTYTATDCASTKPPASAAFSAGTDKGGKKVLTLRLPYGKSGSANYRFVEP